MNTPVYREMVRLLNNKMNVIRNTVYNWFVKGSEYLKKVLPVLKEKLLAKGAVVNCDETWCRVKVAGKYGKKYIWCMVNKEAKVAVYFYDDGSRGRQVLRDFLGYNKIAALQSDGYRSSLSRLLPEGRKNSLTFGSHDGAEVSVLYHTFIETCKMCGVSTLEYFKEFFNAAIKRVQFQMYLRNVEREQLRIISKAIMQGRTDYERSAMPLSSSIATERTCYR